MSIEVITRVWKTTLSTPEKMILLVIADKANDDGTNSWPGVKFIAERASMTERSVQRHIRNLEQRGFLLILKQKGGNQYTRNDRRPNRYDIVLSALDGVTSVEDENNGVTSEAERGDIQDTTGRQTEQNGVTPASPYTSLSVQDTSSIRPAEIRSEEVHEAEIVSQSETMWLEFWKLYPRSEAKKKAREAWMKLSDEDQRLALDAVPVHLEHWRRTKTAKDYIPYGASWLNARRWEDEFDTDYQPDGSLATRIAQHAINKQRQERHDRGRRSHSPRELDSGNNRLE